MCTGARVCTWMWRPEVDLLYSCFSFLKQGLCWFGILRLGQADWPVVLRDQPVSTSQYSDYKFMPPQVASPHGFWESNSDLQACVAGVSHSNFKEKI